jgi:polyphosphate kinase
MTEQEQAIAPPELNPGNYINRELSTISFNFRVLELARDPEIPLLERVKFVAIVGHNLDEFYMVRVAAYIQKLKLGLMTSSRPDGYSPTQLLTEIRQRVITLMIEQRKIMDELFVELARHDIIISPVDEISPVYQDALRTYFYEEIYPVLTPLAADHARPFPFISNLSLNIGAFVRPHNDMIDHTDFVRIKVPEALPRLVNLGSVLNKYSAVAVEPRQYGHFVWIEDIISHNLDLLFPGMDVIEYHPFRVVRNADIDYEHEQDEELRDISAVIEESVRERRFGSIVRLSVPASISHAMLIRLIDALEIDPDRDVYMIDGALGSASLFELDVDRPELKYPPHVPRVVEELQQGMDIFSLIRSRDVLIHHPYDSFAPVEEFFSQAAHDPRVLAIKTTLYRVGKNSPIVQSLMDARENGKQVAVLVELKARFDEENNLEWARALEQKGVHVTYGVEKLPVKTHAKVALVIRRETNGLKRYVHLGTGNYNASTARLYTDLGLLTDDELTSDAMRLFNRLTGYAPATTYQRLLVAPEYLQTGLMELIDNEIQAALQGNEARLIFKMNQLEEDVMIQKLYQASQAGVQIDLIVRGICCLRPGIPGISENIRVRSILGRFLEHPRIYYFHNAPPERRLYAGSADLMRRNLYNRVEVVFPISEPRLQQRVLDMMVHDLSANVHVWEQQPDDSYRRIMPDDGEPAFESQRFYIQTSQTSIDGTNPDTAQPSIAP